MERTKIAVVGATGMVGQRLLVLLENHPYFEVVKLAASKNSAGKRYGDLMANKWKLDMKIPEYTKDFIVEDAMDVKNVANGVKLIFCAVNLDKKELVALEEAYAKEEVVVVSNNSANRMKADVPMIIPEINAKHLDIVDVQRKRLGTKKGFIVVKPNCSIQSYVPVFAAIKEFGIKEASICTYQAISGSGKTFEDWPEMVGNIIPYIGGEEEKSEREPLRVLGTLTEKGIALKEDLVISAQCIRVPVLNGHTATVSVSFRKKPTKEELISALRNYKGLPQERNLPSAPKHFIQYLEEDNRPSVLEDVNYEKGMGVSIGRLREDHLFDYKFVGLSHNTLRGAAGGGVLSAETLVELGYITK